MSARPHFLILGAGSWGTALAIVLNRAGNRITLWTRNDNVRQQIDARRVNEVYLPGMFVDPDIEVVTDLSAAAKDVDYVLLAIPSQQLRPICISLSDLLARETPMIIACKGIERGSLLLMSEVVQSILPNNPVMVLSGPNFAREAASGFPTATNIAGASRTKSEKLIYALGSHYFRPYYCDDVIGVQIGGAVKNVIAIACGMASGRSMGENARAALMTRGLVEMQRLAEVKGGKPETLSGLSGLGDLILTCSSQTSRNMSLGYAIGQGEPMEGLLSMNRSGLTEGVLTAESLYQLSRNLGVSMPICQMVHEVLSGETDLDTAIAGLLSRPLGEE
jgi:glycerol-3-phosphate dehydrogenase (NAD(P)+)